jgi:hypothetical protein
MGVEVMEGDTIGGSTSMAIPIGLSDRDMLIIPIYALSRSARFHVD